MEYRRKCNVCGKIYCYSDKDLEDNAKNTAMAAVSAVGTIASVFGGTRLDTYALSSRSDRYSDKVTDYSRCPFCKSSSTSLITDSEWLEIQNKENRVASQNFHIRRVEINSNASIDSLLKRIKMFLEESDWDSAAAYCEQILDIDPECAIVYVYKLMIEFQVTELDKLALLSEPMTMNNNYKKAMRFADDNLKSLLEEYNYKIEKRKIELIEENNNKKYLRANIWLQNAKNEKDYLEAKKEFDSLGTYKDASSLAVVCCDKAEEARKNLIYEEASRKVKSGDVNQIEEGITQFESIIDWRDSKEIVEIEKNKKIKLEKEAGKNIKIFVSIIILIIAFVILINIINLK